jgi:hypothetical protein
MPDSKSCSPEIASSRLHARRKFFDVHAANGSSIAKEALERIGQLYEVEKQIKGLPPDHRRRKRQERSKPIAGALAAWADETVRKLSRKSNSPPAFRYIAGALDRAPTAASTMGDLRSTTTRPSAPCAASRSAARTTCSPAPTPAVAAPRRCTR